MDELLEGVVLFFLGIGSGWCFAQLAKSIGDGLNLVLM